MLATRRCGFSRHRFAPSELLVGGGWWLDLSRLSGKGRILRSIRPANCPGREGLRPFPSMAAMNKRLTLMNKSFRSLKLRIGIRLFFG